MHEPNTLRPLAYAEFSKGGGGGGGRKFKNNEDQKKNFSIQNQSIFLPKIRWRPKKKVFTQILSVSVLKLSAQVTKGGVCRNFAYYSMLIILSWRPEGGGEGKAPCPP